MFNAIKSTMKKAEAAVVIQNLLDIRIREGVFNGDAHKTANNLVAEVFADRPSHFDGKRGQRPSKIAYAASALSHGIAKQGADRRTTMAFMSSLGQILAEVGENSHLYPLNELDHVLLNSAAATFNDGVAQFNESKLGQEINNILEENITSDCAEDGVISAEIVKLGIIDWEVSHDAKANELSRAVVVTTNYGVKTWHTKFLRTKRQDGSYGLAFLLSTDVPTAGDDIGNFYPAIIVVEGEPLVGLTMKLLSQGEQTIFFCDGDGLKDLFSFALSKLDGTFTILNSKESVIANFPWPYEEDFQVLFESFMSEL